MLVVAGQRLIFNTSLTLAQSFNKTDTFLNVFEMPILAPIFEARKSFYNKEAVLSVLPELKGADQIRYNEWTHAKVVVPLLNRLMQDIQLPRIACPKLVSNYVAIRGVSPSISEFRNLAPQQFATIPFDTKSIRNQPPLYYTQLMTRRQMLPTESLAATPQVSTNHTLIHTHAGISLNLISFHPCLVLLTLRTYD